MLVALRSQSRLRLEGRARTLSGPSPDLSEQASCIAPCRAARYTTFVTTSRRPRRAARAYAPSTALYNFRDNPRRRRRWFLASFPNWATDARTVLALLGVVLYAVLRIAYSLFYNNFGLTPDDLGLGYIDLLIQSAVGTVILLVVVFVVATVVALVYVGLIGSYPPLLRALWQNFRALLQNFRRGFRPAGSSGSESPPVKPGSESATPPQQDPGHRLRAALATGISIAVVGLVLVAGYFTPAPPGWPDPTRRFPRVRVARSRSPLRSPEPPPLYAA